MEEEGREAACTPGHQPWQTLHSTLLQGRGKAVPLAVATCEDVVHDPAPACSAVAMRPPFPLVMSYCASPLLLPLLLLVCRAICLGHALERACGASSHHQQGAGSRGGRPPAAAASRRSSSSSQPGCLGLLVAPRFWVWVGGHDSAWGWVLLTDNTCA